MLSTPPPATTSSRRIRRWVAAPIVALVMIAGGIGWWNRRDTSASTADAPVAVETAAVVTTDMSTTESLTGALGYGPARPVKGGKDGVVTWLPAAGTTVKRGSTIYRVDDQPVHVFYGNMPLYRAIEEPGTVGRDVGIVAGNLQALGYGIGRQPSPGQTVSRTTSVPAADEPAPDDDPPAARASVGKPQPASSGAAPKQAEPEPAKPKRAEPKQAGPKQAEPAPKPSTVTTKVTVRKGEAVLTKSLIAAIKRWQHDAELPVTGTIGLGDVVVLPAEARIDNVTAQQGDSAATPLLTVTPTTKVITVPAEVSRAATIERGDPVTVVLPDDRSVPGKVSAVGTTVEEDEGGGPTDAPKRSVTVTVTDTKALAGIDTAQVQVDFVGETHRDVLAVPVGALVALSEGGYAVQLADGGGLVAVTTGMFSKGLVEVTADGLAEGTRVVTTS